MPGLNSDSHYGKMTLAYQYSTGEFGANGASFVGDEAGHYQGDWACQCVAKKLS